MGSSSVLIDILGPYIRFIAPVGLIPIILCGARMAFIDGTFAPIFPNLRETK